MAADDSRLIPGHIIYMMAVMLAIPAIILLLSGDLFWLEGWAFGIWYIILNTSIVIYLYSHNPALLAERFKFPGTSGDKEWDKYFAIAIGLTFLAWIVVIPLDAKRYGWTVGFPVWLKPSELSGC